MSTKTRNFADTLADAVEEVRDAVEEVRQDPGSFASEIFAGLGSLEQKLRALPDEQRHTMIDTLIGAYASIMILNAAFPGENVLAPFMMAVMTMMREAETGSEYRPATNVIDTTCPEIAAAIRRLATAKSISVNPTIEK